MDQLVYILIIAAIAGINWLIQKSGEIREKKELEKRANQAARKPEPPAETTEPAGKSGEDLARKFLEALGLPPDSERPQRKILPVPPIVESPVPKPADRAPAEPMPKVIKAADLEKRLVEAAEKPRPAQRRVHKTTSVLAETATPAQRIDRVLRTRQGIRQSILAHEILGPPKGLVF